MKRFATQAVHGAVLKPDAHGTLRTPVYDTTAFEFATSADMQRAFEGRLPAHAYTRISNPTVEDLEQRLRLLSGGVGVVATASGMAAISAVVLALARSGANVVAGRYLFGNTRSLFARTLAPWGLATRFVNMLDLNELANAIDGQTSLVFLESVANPQMEVADLPEIVRVAGARRVPVVLDNTVLTPYLFASRTAGVAVEVLSTTKYITGGATSIGGAIIDNGVFDWRGHPRLAAAARGAGPQALIQTLRREVHRNLGGCLSPHNAYLQTLGLETLGLRINQSGGNALRLARHLQAHAKVLAVHYPGLPDSPGHAVATRLFGGRYGGILTFELADQAACFRFMDALRVVRRATNINDNKSLAIHPASTIFCEYAGPELAAMGVNERMIRLSAGIEDPDDLIDDLERGLATL